MFDVASERSGGFELYEVKYLKGKMTRQQLLDELNQIKGIEEINANKVGFVSINGFEDDVAGYTLITGEDVYSLSD